MRRSSLALLVTAVLATACSDGSVVTTAPSTTVAAAETTVDFGPEAAAVARFYAAGESWPLHLRADAVVQFDGQAVGILEAIAPDAVEDWDGNGTVTNGDYISRTAVSRRVFQTVLDVACVPDGADLLCTVGQSDLLYRRAGVAGPAFQQRFRVAAGLITALSLPAVQVGAEAAAAEEAWAGQLASFEFWLMDNHPTDHQEMFGGPCCQSNLIFTPETADRIEARLAEWNQAQ